MVSIRVVWMLVGQSLVLVAMGVRPQRILASRMFMLMVLIVFVLVFMLEFFVGVLVFVVLSQMQIDAGSHTSRGGAEAKCEGLVEEN